MKQLVISPSVEISLSALKPDEVRKVHSWFDYLCHWDEAAEVRENATPLEEFPGVYYYRTPSDLRIFFRIDGETVTIVNVGNVSWIRAVGGLPATGDARVTFTAAPTVP